MKIVKTPPLEQSFGYKHFLKTYWLKGKLPSVKRGLYGDVLTKQNISLEHIKPHSNGGRTILANLALATKSNNETRGNESIKKFLTMEKVQSYLDQFIGIKVDELDGDKYHRVMLKVFKRLLK